MTPNKSHCQESLELPSLSEAHEKSGFAVVDPVYNASRFVPEPDIKRGAAPWLYGEAELECWRLQVLRRRMEAAKLKVGYPGTFHQPSPQATFHLPLGPGQTHEMELQAVGSVVVSLGDRVIYRGAATEALHSIAFPIDLSAGAQTLRVELTTQGEPPALLIETGPLSTGLAPWSWSADGIPCTPAKAFPQTRSGVPPHCMELQETVLKPASRDGDLFDFGCELLGRITFRCAGEPALFVGESQAEARNNAPGDFEQSPAIRPDGEGCWISEHPLAFRYLRITGGEPFDIECRALFHPAQYRGAFACSDERLTRIWMNSAYTLRLCLHDFLIDGVKRDRLPWTGDLAMSLMADAYTFGDAEIARRSLTALGRAGIEQTHINGIVDYSLWWIVAQDHFQQYFGDAAHLRCDWPRIKETLERLAARCDADGQLATTAQEWLFIDWVDDNKLTALQILWWWAQCSGAKLAQRMGEATTAARLRGSAEHLAKTLYSCAWGPKACCWRGLPDNASAASRHANLLAVVSGLATPGQTDAIRAVLLGSEANGTKAFKDAAHSGQGFSSSKTQGDADACPGLLDVAPSGLSVATFGSAAKPVGTPYMAGFENIALGRLGEIDSMLERVIADWGGMLDRGATTFWEAWDPRQNGAESYAFYGRPYAKSLCHAWSAGPAAFLVSEIFGLRPCEDGWACFTLAPRLGSLQWACATVPTPHGEIEVSAEPNRMTLRLPAGTAARWGEHTFTGPGCFAQDLK